MRKEDFPSSKVKDEECVKCGLGVWKLVSVMRQLINWDLCFRYVASGPLVRSSYRAGEFFIEAMIKGDAPKH